VRRECGVCENIFAIAVRDSYRALVIPIQLLNRTLRRPDWQGAGALVRFPLPEK
jgi:hypothetical protein